LKAREDASLAVFVVSGIDIVEISRIEDAVRKFGERFLRRIFLEAERAYCESQSRPAAHYAARFACKEAVSKAFSTGIGKHIGWRDIEVVREPSGQPRLVLHGKGADLARRRNVAGSSVSLSHCREYAAAHAVLWGNEPT
jgi:holo-[acyl-carrier protein] synthase